MKTGRPFLERLAAEGWEETMPGLPIVELAGDNRILIENHRGIVQYSQEQISVLMKYGKLVIYGCSLHLSCMTRERLVIHGKIKEIHLERREQP